MTNENDDWEIEFDRRLEKDHLTIQVREIRVSYSRKISPFSFRKQTNEQMHRI